MRSIVFTNEKGGVAKTTLALHFAAGLALRDKRVLLIDGDPQGCLSQQLGAEHHNGLHRLLTKGQAWRDCLVTPDWGCWSSREGTIGSLTLLPSSYASALIPLEQPDPLLLRTLLAEIAAQFDVCLIDTPPSPTELHGLLYFAADGALLPTKLEALSLRAVGETEAHLREHALLRRGRGLKPIKLLGVVPTLWRATNSNLYGWRKLEEHFGAAHIWEPLPLRTIWTDREYAQKSIFAYAPGSDAAQEMNVLVERVSPYVD